MNEHEVGRWAKAVAENWQNHDIESNVKLFSRCKNYRETPFSPNAAEIKDGIRSLWNEIKTQSEIQVEVETVCFQYPKVVFHYRARFLDGNTPHESAGIWVTEFKDGYCISFEQFFNVDT